MRILSDATRGPVIGPCSDGRTLNSARTRLTAPPGPLLRAAMLEERFLPAWLAAPGLQRTA